MTETSPLRVLHIITRLIVGGAQENTLLTCEGLAAMPEYEVTLASGIDRGPEGDLLERAEKSVNLVLIPELGRAISPIAFVVRNVNVTDPQTGNTISRPFDDIVYVGGDAESQKKIAKEIAALAKEKGVDALITGNGG